MMHDNSFLRSVALHLNNHFGDELNSMLFVFPNRRAGLFFSKYLAQARKRVFVAPSVTTINELFDSLAQQTVNTDRIDLLVTLHEVYCEVTHRSLALDDFLFWGQMMLNDFDEIDDYLVDAKRIFVETANLKQLDAAFTPELSNAQKEALIALFGDNYLTIDDSDSMKDRFAAMWNHLAVTHEKFAQRIIDEKKGVYKGLQHKLIVNQLSDDKGVSTWDNAIGNKRIVFIGFNALTNSEEKLLLYAKDRDALFFWDYCSADLRDLKGSLYERNTSLFPSILPVPIEQEPRLTDFNNVKTIKLYSISSDISQAKVAGYLLSRQLSDNIESDDSIFENTAVVLPDEHLLLPMLSSLDERIRHINVTMGYPLIATPVYALIDSLCQLQLKRRVSAGNIVFYHKDVETVLCHSYVKRWDEICRPKTTSMQVYDQQIQLRHIYATESDLQQNDLLFALFRAVDNNGLIPYLKNVCQILLDAENNLSAEQPQVNDMHLFLNQTIDMLDRLHLKFPQSVPLEMQGLVRLIKQLAATETISFRGEPLHGLQIMGALEARALDFSNLIILSVNEGVFPKSVSANTCLPYQVRKAYGLPTHELADSVESYNFYRMLLHAQNVTLVYDNRQDSDSRGEVSRFVMQLRYKYGVNVEEIQVLTQNAETHIDMPVPFVVKTQELVERLNDKFTNPTRGISASAIKNYLHCPLKFYLNSVEYISEEERLEDEIQSNEFGTIVHYALETIYKEIAHKENRNLITSELLTDLLDNDNPLVKQHVEKAFRDKYMKDETTSIAGQEEMIFEVVLRYVRMILQRDKEYAPFFFLGAEYVFRDTFVTTTQNKQVVLNGSIDRIDLKEQPDGSFVLRVIDYKTGTPALQISSVDQLFSRESDDAYNAMQACMYCLVIEKLIERNALFYNDIPLSTWSGNKTIAIEPHLFYVRSANDKDTFSTEIVIKKDRNDKGQQVVWSADVAKQYTAQISDLLSEILNPEIPFEQTKIKTQCFYCPFGDTCNRQTEPPHK